MQEIEYLNARITVTSKKLSLVFMHIAYFSSMHFNAIGEIDVFALQFRPAGINWEL